MPSKFVENVHLATAKKMLDTGRCEKDVIEHLKGVWLDSDEIAHVMSALSTQQPPTESEKSPKKE